MIAFTIILVIHFYWYSENEIQKDRKLLKNLKHKMK